MRARQRAPARLRLDTQPARAHASAQLPIFHAFRVKSAGGKQSVPCLLLPGGGVVDGSDAIMRWADERAPAAAAAAAAAPPPPLLFPPALEAEVAALCARLDRGLGAAARTFGYAHVLGTPQCRAAMLAGVPAPERWAAALGFLSLAEPLIRRGYGVTPARGARALEALRATFDEVGALLADGRRFLAGDTLTAADVTFVALAAPALLLPYGPPPHGTDDAPEAMAHAAAALRATPAGAFALRVWDEERRRVLAPAAAAAARL